MRLWPLAALLLLVPPAAAQEPRLDLWVEHPEGPLTLEESMPLRVGFELHCGDVRPTRIRVDLQVPTGNAFNITLDRVSWDIPVPECSGPIRRETRGTFRFLIPLSPFHAMTVPLSAWAEDDTTVWAQGSAPVVAMPDATFSRPGFPSLVTASLAPLPPATRSGDRSVQDVPWNVTNFGRGAFVANLSLESKPAWLEVVQMPTEVASGPDSLQGSRGSFTMQVAFPEPCPAPAAVAVLALDVRSPDPRSHARAQTRVQGIIPCKAPAGAGAPGLGAPFAAAAIAAVALRAGARHKR